MSRDTILGALKEGAGNELPAPRPTPDGAADPVALFRSRLEAVGGRLVTGGDVAGLYRVLEQLLASSDGDFILWENAAVAAEVGLTVPAESRQGDGWWVTRHRDGVVGPQLEGQWRAPEHELAAAASVSIAPADWGIAETGSVVQSNAQGRSRVLPVVAGAHLAVLQRDRLLTTAEEFYSRPAPQKASVEVVVTGPSRTADIEKKLILGVHGPRFFGVVLVGQAI